MKLKKDLKGCATCEDTDSMFVTLRDSSTADLSQVLADVKKYAGEVVEAEFRELQSSFKQRSEARADRTWHRNVLKRLIGLSCWFMKTFKCIWGEDQAEKPTLWILGTSAGLRASVKCALAPIV